MEKTVNEMKKPANKEKVKVEPSSPVAEDMSKKLYCMEFKQVKQLEKILAINDQARQLGNLSFENAYGGLVTFITGNIKEKH